MKVFLFGLISLLLVNSAFGQLGGVLDRASSSASSKVNSKVNQSIDKNIDKGINKAEKGVNEKVKKKPSKPSEPASPQQPERVEEQDEDESAAPATATVPTETPANKGIFTSATNKVLANLSKSYENYDFVPGSKILFADDFRTEAEGEFAQHWDLLSGQAALSKVGNGLVMKVTDGQPAKLTPLLKEKNYLPKEFTLEYDFYQTPDAAGLMLWFDDKKGNPVITYRAERDEASINYQADGQARTLTATFPEQLRGAAFTNRWHHVAFILKDRTMKLYIDQYRVVNAPQNTAEPTRVVFGGNATRTNPLVFRNVRIAEGGGPDLIDERLAKGKYISYGISFGANRATIKPESMGELTIIAKYLTDTPKVRFEIGSYIDTEGSDEFSRKLTQARAEAVRNKLISMGVTADRLTTKGYGDAKPIAKNTTFDGRAQNRRIEFVKKK